MQTDELKFKHMTDEQLRKMPYEEIARLAAEADAARDLQAEAEYLAQHINSTFAPTRRVSEFDGLSKEDLWEGLVPGANYEHPLEAMQNIRREDMTSGEKLMLEVLNDGLDNFISNLKQRRNDVRILAWAFEHRCHLNVYIDEWQLETATAVQ